MREPWDDPDANARLAARIGTAIAGLPLPTEPHATDPAIAHQRDRYRLNRAQRRAADRQEHQ